MAEIFNDYVCNGTRPCASNDTSTYASTATNNPGYSHYMVYLAYLEVISALPTDVIALVTSIVYILGISSNCFLLVYLIKFKRYRSPMFALIMSLAFCDMGTCLFAMLWTNIAMYMLRGPPFLCVVLICATALCYLTSILHMVFFSVIRFYQLVFPLQALANVTVSLIIKSCACLWIVTVFVVSGIPTYYNATFVPLDGRLVYFCSWTPNDYQIFLETTYLLLPNLLMMFFHTTKHYIVRKQSRISISEQYGAHEKRQSTDARAITVVIVVFCVTSWPQLFQFYIHYVFGYPLQSYNNALNAIACTLEYINSAFNPFIYVFCARSVRKDVLTMFCSRCQQK